MAHLDVMVGKKFLEVGDGDARGRHGDVVVGLFPEGLAVGGADDEAVGVEPEVFDDLLVFRSGRVEVPSLDLAGEAGVKSLPLEPPSIPNFGV